MMSKNLYKTSFRSSIDFLNTFGGDMKRTSKQLDRYLQNRKCLQF